jgi:hypothetical protein
MTRLLARAILVSATTALVLLQVDSDRQLVFWELVLITVLVWQMRELPRGEGEKGPSLFDLTRAETPRIPRAVVGHELAVLDALSGHMAPERRLQPALRRIAAHRLERVGVDLRGEEARRRLGHESWVWLTGTSPSPPDTVSLGTMLSRIEEL